MTQNQEQPNKEDLEALLRELLEHEEVRKMARFRQHGKVSTLQHCEHVARKSWKLAQTFRLHSDRRALVRGAMLHDFYLYDWHVQDGTHRWHGFHHPERAAENAARYIGVSEKEAE
ncbi:MAG: hypothetical protein IJ822_09605, partial [Pyramidobacter sp.]|nr:hypothetical protein [Pyramidobacter sp.]